MKTEINEINRCVADIREQVVQLGVTPKQIRLGIRVSTHRLDPALTTGPAIQAGADLVASYEVVTLEQAINIACPS